MPERSIPRLFISAPSKSSGKTTLTLGLTREFVRQGLSVQTFKKGPDFIDPLWHSLASGRAGRNLDSWLMSQDVLAQSLEKHSRDADLVIVEGDHGLHDGVDPEGSNSSAGLARDIGAPVVLVVDGTGLNRAAAALVLGQREMEPKAQIGGVILNRIRTDRQAKKQIQAIESYTGIKVLGVIGEQPLAQIQERHMGLTTTGETDEAERLIEAAADLVRDHVDTQALLELARQAPALSYQLQPSAPVANQRYPIGVLRNEAFCFYYPENLEALEQAGGELIFLDPMRDQEIPEIKGLYIGGGFPESFLAPLESNIAFRTQLKERLAVGLPYWAECGGLIYLAESASFKDQVQHQLVGWLSGQVKFQQRPVGYGYMELEAKGPHWLQGTHRAHEFHYSQLIGSNELACQFKVNRGHGLGEQQDGLLKGQGLAGYAHLHALSSPDWAYGFLQQVSQFATR